MAGTDAPVSDDTILSLWRTARPSMRQDAAMTYSSGIYGHAVPKPELRHLVELAIDEGRRQAKGVTQ